MDENTKKIYEIINENFKKNKSNIEEFQKSKNILQKYKEYKDNKEKYKEESKEWEFNRNIDERLSNLKDEPKVEFLEISTHVADWDEFQIIHPLISKHYIFSMIEELKNKFDFVNTVVFCSNDVIRLFESSDINDRYSIYDKQISLIVKIGELSISIHEYSKEPELEKEKSEKITNFIVEKINKDKEHIFVEKRHIY